MSNSKRYAYELCDKCRDSYPLPIPYMDWEQEDKEIKELLEELKNLLTGMEFNYEKQIKL